jgi:glycosyltransferase involved in cell wall biosynthesis
LKILMLAPQPFFTPRGTPFSVLYRLRALSTLGHAVDLVTYHIGENPEIPGLTIHRIPPVPGVRTVKIGPSPTKILLDVLLLGRALWLGMVNRYDLIHSHEEAGLIGALLSRLNGTPHIYDMHSSLPQQFANFGAYDTAPVVAIFRGVEAAMLAGADGVITICPDLARHVEARRYPRPHRLIENTFTDEPDPHWVESRAGRLRQQHDLGRRSIVLYTGTLEAYQGLSLLLEAASLMEDSRPEVLFVIVGGRRSQVRELTASIARRGLASRFLLTGQVPPEEIPAWISLATLLVSPRVSGTNTPLKIYQYLKSGVPLVATGIHSHTQVLDASVCRLTPPTAEGLAGGIRELLVDPERASALAGAARRQARAEYDNQVYIRKMADLLQAVTGISARLPEAATAGT